MPEDLEGDSFENPDAYNEALFAKMAAEEKQTFTYVEALKRTKTKLARMKRLPSQGDIDSVMISAYNSEKALEWG